MINLESESTPTAFSFDVAIVAVGYERRCRWITEQHDVRAKRSMGLEFGFLTVGAYEDNRSFFERRSFQFINGIEKDAPGVINEIIRGAVSGGSVNLFVDISSMSREMMANVILGIEAARAEVEVIVTAAYAPSKFSGNYGPAPLRLAGPIKPSLAGWSSQPEQPLGVIFGLGCERSLALGALQVLEPDKTWLFWPKGIDEQFDAELKRANQHIGDIFDVSDVEYEIASPTVMRGRFEALLNAVEGYFRIIAVPLGPKVFAWLTISTVVFMRRTHVGVWTFSSKAHAVPTDRDAEGPVIWHRATLAKRVAASDLPNATP